MKTLSIAVGNSEYNVSVHVTRPSSPKTPTLVYVTEKGHPSIGSYVYTIGRGADTYTSVLQQGEDASVQDLATNLGRVLVKKFACPSYVCMSGYFLIQDYGELSRQIVHVCEEED